jgi:Na+-driven multidrug efflux pump
MEIFMEHQKTAGSQITEGTIWKQLLLFFFPILLGTFFQQFYNTIDMIIVGRFVGTEALASVGGSTSQIVNLIVGFFTGLTSGAGVIISQFYGARDERSLNESIHTAYAFCILGSILFMILGYAFSPAMLRAMKTSPELLPVGSNDGAVCPFPSPASSNRA